VTTDFDAWCRTAAPISSGHAVIMRGLSSAVQAEILLGLQQRCRRGVITYLSQLRCGSAPGGRTLGLTELVTGRPNHIDITGNDGSGGVPGGDH
jgi:hypothetical protein